MADLRAAWHRPRLRILVVLWLLVVVAWLARASPSDELDSLEQIMREQGLTAASLAYGRIGGEPTLRAIGTERERVFPYYSLSKPITAAAVMAQVERETVSLSDEVSGATVR